MSRVEVELAERTDRRLGRHRVHDARSRSFAFGAASKPPTKSGEHKRVAPIWDQGDVGSCTGNAAMGCLMTAPLWRAGWKFTEADALKLYILETQIDDREIPGHYPPDDTGSAGIYSAKALRKMGLISGWLTAFGLNATLNALVSGPVSLGIPWPESFMDPARDGLLKMGKRPRYAGGHQVELTGVDCTRQLVKVANSWGPGWGANGYGFMRWADLGYLLADGGDTTIYVI